MLHIHEREKTKQEVSKEAQKTTKTKQNTTHHRSTMNNTGEMYLCIERFSVSIKGVYVLCV